MSLKIQTNHSTTNGSSRFPSQLNFLDLTGELESRHAYYTNLEQIKNESVFLFGTIKTRKCCRKYYSTG